MRRFDRWRPGHTTQSVINWNSHFINALCDPYGKVENMQ